MSSAINSTPIALPGRDTVSSSQQMHQNVAQSLSVPPATLVPAREQPVADSDLKHLMQPSSTEADVADFIAGIKGQPRTESSKGFLAILLGRLKKQHPDKEITLKEDK